MTDRLTPPATDCRKLADRLDAFETEDIECSIGKLAELQGLLGLAAEALRELSAPSESAVTPEEGDPRPCVSTCDTPRICSYEGECRQRISTQRRGVSAEALTGYSAERLSSKLNDLHWDDQQFFWLLPDWLRSELLAFLLQSSAASSGVVATDRDAVITLLTHIEDVVDDENWEKIDVALWNAVTKPSAAPAGVVASSFKECNAVCGSVPEERRCPDCPSRLTQAGAPSATPAADLKVEPDIETLHAIMFAVVLPFAQSATARKTGNKKLVYNKETKRIDVVRFDGQVLDSFEPPEEIG